jgi:hypothetical protein
MPISPEARDRVIRTIIAEGGNESQAGQAAIAWVIRNRVDRQRWGRTIREVTTPSQFSAWNPNNPAYRLTQTPANSPIYQRIGAIVDGVFDDAIPDPTKGADHYFNPRDASPSWGNDNPGSHVMIGQHRFLNRNGAGATTQPIRAPTPGVTGPSQFSYDPSVKRQFTSALEYGLSGLEESLRDKGIPINVTSGYRDPEHNEKAGGAKGSQHLHGNAIDISLKGLNEDQKRTLVAAVLANPSFRGFGYYPNSDSIHIDTREGPRVAWGSNYRGSSVGQGWSPWMTEAVTQWRSNQAPPARPLGGRVPEINTPIVGPEGQQQLDERTGNRAYVPPAVAGGDPNLRRVYDAPGGGGGGGGGGQTPLPLTVTAPAAPAASPMLAGLTPGDKARMLSDPTRYGVSPEMLAALRNERIPTAAASLPAATPVTTPLPPPRPAVTTTPAVTAVPPSAASQVPPPLTGPQSDRLPVPTQTLTPSAPYTGIFNPEPIAGNNSTTGVIPATYTDEEGKVTGYDPAQPGMIIGGGFRTPDAGGRSEFQDPGMFDAPDPRVTMVKPRILPQPPVPVPLAYVPQQSDSGRSFAYLSQQPNQQINWLQRLFG